MGYLYLFIAVICEILGTNLLKTTDGFTKPLQVAECLISYLFCFYTLLKAITFIPLSVAYASWGAIGIIIITLISVLYWKESINIPTLIGLAFIVIGTLLVNLYGSVD
ncbi:membrane transporter of cations and cationic drugs [Melissococcus plutonius DAT561]|uniref:Membrane transporter of cations and cationic drugs n=1 Tax=Melissococcus plutonius TaxID=33970 RepID=A0A2Z5Y1X2_9ENTE|nr:SMR family transporter [Melissococcus plutonius]BAL61914.1 membrane transporter of cations and cationic drugs [Melissococcus plutonius DAT561]BBC60784.1 membrane transporter of cations and cationic drugs [Melissococcus plutonius]